MRSHESHESEEGFSLVELLVSMAIFSALMAMIMSVFIMSMQQSRDSMARAEMADQARMAIAQLDSQIRSGSVIEDPQLESLGGSGVPVGYSVRILTERDGNRTCAQWRVLLDGTGQGDLEYRTWPAWHPESVTAWNQVATGIQAPSGPYAAASPDTYPPFILEAPNGGDSVIKSLLITLRVKAEGAVDTAKPTLITTTVTGRNTIFGRGGLECSNVPPA